MKQLSLNKIVAKTKKYIFGDLLGNNSSKALGDGYDFAQISEYSYGQNIRRIDPYSSAKKNELHIREYFESKEANIHVVVCANGSLHFGTKVFKQDKIAELIALLGFSSIKNADSFSLSIISDKVESEILYVKSKNKIISLVSKFLDMDMKRKKIDTNFIRDYLLKGIKRRSIIFLISDFFESHELKAVSKKHQVIAIRLRDIFEQNPSAIGEIDILNPVDLKTQKMIFSDSSILKYKKRLKLHDMKLGESFKRSGISLLSLYTHEDSFMKLEKAFRGL